MKSFVIYNQNGRILNCLGVQDDYPQEDFYTFETVGHIDVEEGWSDMDSYFVSEGMLVEKGERPTPYHNFDYPTKTWVEDAESKVMYLRQEKAKNRKELLRDGLLYPDENGHVFQIDPDSQRLITGKALRLKLEPDNVNTVYWRSKDNEMVAFTHSEFIEFAKAVSDRVEAIMMASFNA